MRKIGTKEYAELLFSITQETSEQECTQLLQGFVSLLSKHRVLSRITAIEKQYSQLVDEREGRLRAVLQSPIPIPALTRTEIENELKIIFDKKEILLHEMIDPTLIGGWKIRTENYLIDRSIQGRLDKLKATLIK